MGWGGGGERIVVYSRIILQLQYKGQDMSVSLELKGNGFASLYWLQHIVGVLNVQCKATTRSSLINNQ